MRFSGSRVATTSCTLSSTRSLHGSCISSQELFGPLFKRLLDLTRRVTWLQRWCLWWAQTMLAVAQLLTASTGANLLEAAISRPWRERAKSQCLTMSINSLRALKIRKWLYLQVSLMPLWNPEISKNCKMLLMALTWRPSRSLITII